jgi:hypothetical protein
VAVEERKAQAKMAALSRKDRTDTYHAVVLWPSDYEFHGSKTLFKMLDELEDHRRAVFCSKSEKEAEKVWNEWWNKGRGCSIFEHPYDPEKGRLKLLWRRDLSPERQVKGLKAVLDARKQQQEKEQQEGRKKGKQKEQA